MDANTALTVRPFAGSPTRRALFFRPQDPRRLALARILFCASVLSASPPIVIAIPVVLMGLGIAGRWAALATILLLPFAPGHAPLVASPMRWFGVLPPTLILLFSRAWDAYSLDALAGLYYAGDNDEDALRERSGRGLYQWPLVALGVWAFAMLIACAGPILGGSAPAGPLFRVLWLALPVFLPLERGLDVLARFVRDLYPVSRRIVIYDGDCGFCTRTAMVVRRLDALGHFEYFNFRVELDHLDPAYRRDLTPEACEREMFYSTRWGNAGGFHAFRAMTWAMPLFWLAAPFLYLPPVAWAGVRAYRWVAENRMSIRLRNIEKCKLD